MSDKIDKSLESYIATEDDLNYLSKQIKEELSSVVCIPSLSIKDLKLMYLRCVLKLAINKSAIEQLIEKVNKNEK